MKTKNILISLIVMLAVTAPIFQSCEKEPENQAPQIENLISTPNTSSSNRLPGGEYVTVSVTATDADKDNLAYSWEADGGIFDGQTNQSSIIWAAPMSTQYEDYIITATVSDGAKTTSKSINIYVDKTTPGINATPKIIDFGTSETELQIRIHNTGEGQLKWETYGENASWLTVNPTSGIVNTPNDTSYITLTIDREGMNLNNYSEEFRLRNSDDINNFVNIIVSMEVAETASIHGYTYYSETTIPVSGVLVSIGQNSSITGTDGYYEISDILTGNHTLTAIKDGHDNYSTNIEIGSGTNDYNIEVTSALYTHNLFGTITAELTGVPIPYVDVVVLNPDGTESNLKTQSSSSGYYQIPTVPQGERTITFTHDEYNASEINIFMANSDHELDFQMSTCFPVVATGNYEVNNLFQIIVIGNILSIGCSNVIQHGHCWSIYPNPTIDNDKTEFGSIIEPYYTSEITNFSQNTEYYVRAYAENTIGVSYGNQVVFSSPHIIVGTFTDPRDGQIYNTIDYNGVQTWFAENLNYQTSNSWWYGNSSTNGDIYGRLYKWDAALNACPSGWHLPSDEEWKQMEMALGMSQSEADDIDWRGTDEGGKMKEADASYWNSPNTGATNSIGFTALPGGYRGSSGSFNQLRGAGYWWSSTEYSGTYPWRRYLSYNSAQVNRYHMTKTLGFSVRCIKN